MEIVHIAAELAPIAKVGGLGDVVHGLSRELSQRKCRVEVILPKYNTLLFDQIKDLKPFIGDLIFEFDGKKTRAKVWKGLVDGVEVAFIESKDYFERGMIYGCPDDTTRFSFFSKAALEYLNQGKRHPDILHIHDWHSSLVAPLMFHHYRKKGLEHAKVVLTIHNLFYQGKSPISLLDKISLPMKDELSDPQNFREVNLLKGGIVYSDFLTTVSPTYAKELLAMAPGDPLAELLSKHKSKFKGILNGIDFDTWDPAHDPWLDLHFSAENRAKKKELQKLLRKTLSLEDENSPIVSAIARLTPQKGPHLIKHALYRTLERGGQFVFLGSAPEGDTLEIFSNLKRKFAGSRHVHIELSYNEKLSHLVYAASDLFLVPSIFEPCGLTQLIAMRYGALPLVRSTGGLSDTVFDEVNGFTFREPVPEAICRALDRAFWCWFHEKGKWEQMALQAMKEDHSWKKSTEEYLAIYQKITPAIA